MQWNTLKKAFNWKYLLVLTALIMLGGCFGFAILLPFFDQILLVLFILLSVIAIILFEPSHTTEAIDLDHAAPPTNAGILSFNWEKAENSAQNSGQTIDLPAGNYQLSLPFSDYTRTGKTLRPNNHFHLEHAFHFGIPLLSKKDAQGNFPETIDEAKHSNTPSSLSFTPVASNQQQLDEHMEWLSTEENMLSVSLSDSEVRLYKPITLKRDNQVVATINSLLVERNQVEKAGRLSLSMTGMYGSIKTTEPNTSYGSGTFSFVVKNLDAGRVHKIEKEIQSIKHLSKERQMLAQLQILTDLKALCKKGSTLTVSYDIKTVTGPETKHYTIDLNELVKAQNLALMLG